MAALTTTRISAVRLLGHCTAAAWLAICPPDVFCHFGTRDSSAIAETPIVPVAADVNAVTTAFLAKYPNLPATVTRIGNSSAGTTKETAVWGRTKTFPDGAPMRLAIPQNADRIGLEYSFDRKTVLLRVHSYWNEGGWHDTYITPEGKVVGGMFDVPFPRRDVEKRKPANAWQFGTGFWMENGLPAGDAAYRAGLPFTLLSPGANSGTKGYTWKSDDSGLVITTPKANIYGLVAFETAVFDPANPSLCFTQYDSYVMDWSARGNGKEVKTFAPSFNWTKYPTDPRRTRAATTHPGPLSAVRVGGKLYVLSGENEILLHRWDAVTKLLVPVAAVYVRPDQLPTSIPGAPPLKWGQGAICRAGTDGNFTADRWQIFDATTPMALWNGYLYDVDPDGNLYFLPRWQQLKDAGDGAKWQTFDRIRGVFSPANIHPVTFPDTLKTANQCEQIRIDWQSGDLIAVVERGGKWCLERYPKWRGSTSPKAIKPAYTTAPIALSVRRQYPSSARWSARWYASTDPAAGVPLSGFGTMAVSGGFVFVAEAQAGGVRIYRLSDGSIVGRVADRLHTNSTIDNPTQIQVVQNPSEFRISLMDFHGKSALVWRIAKTVLR